MSEERELEHREIKRNNNIVKTLEEEIKDKGNTIRDCEEAIEENCKQIDLLNYLTAKVKERIDEEEEEVSE